MSLVLAAAADAATTVRVRRRRADRVLDPGAAGPGRRGRHGVRQGRGALGALAGADHALPGLPVHGAGRRVPRLRPDHRLHRRDHDAVPVRADADRPGRRRLGHRGAARSAGRTAADRRHRPRRPARRRPWSGRSRAPSPSASARRWPPAGRSDRSPQRCSPTICSRSS